MQTSLLENQKNCKSLTLFHVFSPSCINDFITIKNKLLFFHTLYTLFSSLSSSAMHGYCLRNSPCQIFLSLVHDSQTLVVTDLHNNLFFALSVTCVGLCSSIIKVLLASIIIILVFFFFLTSRASFIENLLLLSVL